MNAFRVKVIDARYGPESFSATLLIDRPKDEVAAQLAQKGWTLKGISTASAADLEELPTIEDLRSQVDKLIEQRRKLEAENAKRQAVLATQVVPPQPPPPPVGPYVYKMVQIPPTISLRAEQGSEAAAYLQGVVNSYAREGWEFYRVDPITVHVPAGCLGGLFGVKEQYVQYHVITFRRPT